MKEKSAFLSHMRENESFDNEAESNALQLDYRVEPKLYGVMDDIYPEIVTSMNRIEDQFSIDSHIRYKERWCNQDQGNVFNDSWK